MTEYAIEKEAKLNNRLNKIVSDLPDYASKYINDRRSIGFATSTLLIYAYELDQFINYQKMKHPEYDTTSIEFLSKIDLDMLTEYLDPNRVFITRTGKKAKNNVANLKTKKSTLKSFLDYYCDAGYLVDNCSVQLDAINLVPKKIEPLTDLEIEKIFYELKREETQSAQKRKSRDLCSTRDIAIFAILLQTGISAEELVALNIDDIHLPEYTNEISDRKRWLNVTDMAGNTRTVFISKQVEDAIRDYWGEDRFALHPLPETADAFIVTQKGTRMSVRALQILVKKHCQNAGILDVTPSRLRITYLNKSTK